MIIIWIVYCDFAWSFCINHRVIKDNIPKKIKKEICIPSLTLFKQKIAREDFEVWPLLFYFFPWPTAFSFFRFLCLVCRDQFSLQNTFPSSRLPDNSFLSVSHHQCTKRGGPPFSVLNYCCYFLNISWNVFLWFLLWSLW